jgi:(S)-ureidoglycine aminohydrolase
MDLVGTTRTCVQRSHALITADSHVPSDLPGWERSRGIILISPRMGSQFVQYLALMEPGGSAGPAPPFVERVLYVLEGEVALKLPAAGERTLRPGGFAYCPPGVAVELRAVAASRLNLFEKRYLNRSGVVAPGPLCGHEQEMAGAPFLGDSDAMLKVLLPADPRFDLAVNVFTYRPGATLPFVEVHVMEHGLLMLEGQGVYRLDEQWYPVKVGDAIWMAPYCPQWFVAMGKSNARYLYYKDVNRDPLEEDA